jgi:hypothetical protein
MSSSSPIPPFPSSPQATEQTATSPTPASIHGNPGFIRARRRLKKPTANVGEAGHADPSPAATSVLNSSVQTIITPAIDEEELAAAATRRSVTGDAEDRPSVLLTSNNDGTYTFVLLDT